MIPKITAIIDGKNAGTEWGAYPAEGMLSALLSLPEAGELIANDWHERNGVEVSPAPVLTAIREVTLPFAVQESRATALLDHFKSSTIHTLTIPELSASAEWKIALRDTGRADYFPSTRVIDPLFAVFLDPAEPTGTVPADGAEFFSMLHSLGFQDLTGTREEIEKGAEVKEYLTGQKSPLTLQSYDITIPFYYGGTDLMNARTAITRYLLQPGERTLTYEGRTIKGVYLKSDTASLIPTVYGGWWWVLSVTIKVTTF